MQNDLSFETICDCSKEEEIQKIVRIIQEFLSKKHFSENCQEKTIISFKEITANVKEHCEKKMAKISFGCSKENYLQSFYFNVYCEGGNFSLSQVLRDLHEKMLLGEREHGLLRAMRYGSELSQNDYNIHWEIEETRKPFNSTFGKRYEETTIIFDYTCEKIRIADEVYSFRSFHLFLRMLIYSLPNNFIIENVDKSFFALLFEPLRRSGKHYILFEVRGRHPTALYVSLETFSKHFFEYMKKVLSHKFLLVYINSEKSDHDYLKDQSQIYNFSMYEDVSSCSKCLKKMEDKVEYSLKNRDIQDKKTDSLSTKNPKGELQEVRRKKEKQWWVVALIAAGVSFAIYWLGIYAFEKEITLKVTKVFNDFGFLKKLFFGVIFSTIIFLIVMWFSPKWIFIKLFIITLASWTTMVAAGGWKITGQIWGQSGELQSDMEGVPLVFHVTVAVILVALLVCHFVADKRFQNRYSKVS